MDHRISICEIDDIIAKVENIKNMDSRRALKLAMKGLELSQKIGYVKGEAILRVKIGGIYSRISEYTKGIDYIGSVIPVLELHHLDFYLSAAYTILGNIFYELSYYETAFEYYNKSIDIAEKNDFQDRLSIAHNNIGEIYKALKDYNRALEHYEISIHIDREIDFKACKGLSYTNIAEIYYLQGHYVKALEVMNTGFDLLKKYSYENVFCEVYKLYALISWRLYGYERARSYFSMALDFAERKMAYNYKIDILIFYHEFLLEYKQLDQAILALSDAYEMSISNLLHEQSLRICKHFTEAYQKSGDFSLALKYYKLYIMHNEDYSKERIKQISEGIELRISLEKIKLQSEKDHLTGIPNRRKLLEYLKKQWGYAQKHSKNLSVLMIDIDFFKEYNDNYGHLDGDQCLKTVARHLLSSLKKGDFLSRYGGDEFIAVLPDTDYDGACLLSEKLRNAILDAKIPNKYSPVSEYVTITVGASAFVPQDTSVLDDFIKKADDALYYGKRNGRNQVVVV